jgi:diacylglycerol O-acyltransferase
MTDVETLLWGLETRDARLRPVITVVGLFDRSPDHGAVVARFERLTRMVPRLRDRVVPGPVGWSAPRWEPDPDFDLAYHLRRVGAAPSAPAPGSATDLDALLRLAEPMAADGFDLARPLWQAVFVDGLPSGGAGLVFRLHHTFTDGLGLVQLAARMFDVHRRPATEPELAGLSLGGVPTAVTRLREDVVHELRRSGRLARRALPVLAGGLLEALRDPEEGVRDTMAYLRSAGQLAAPSAAPLSRVMTGRSLGSRLAALDFSLADAVSVGRACGGTVNDVFVAGVLDGLRRYHAKHGSLPPALRIGVPVSRRAPGGTADAGIRDTGIRDTGIRNTGIRDTGIRDTGIRDTGIRDTGIRDTGAEDPDAGGTEPVATGNNFVPLRLAAPLQVRDRRARVVAVHHLLLGERAQPALELLDGTAAVVNRVPLALLAVASVLGSVDVMASNVAGSPVPLYLGGARVERLVPFGPRSGAGLNVTLLSYAGRLSIGLHIDPAATPDVEQLVSCLQEGLDDTMRAA